MFRSIKKIVVFILISSFCHQAFALGLTISTHHLNSLLNLQFPISQHYLEYTLTASKPKIALYAKTQSVAITARINVINKHYRLVADATFEGQIMFDKTENVLKVSNPLLSQFNVVDNSFPEAKASITSIKSTVGQHLPIAVLIDFNQIRNELFQLSPSNLTIVEGGLNLEY